MATSFNGPLKVYQRQNSTNDGSKLSSQGGLTGNAGAVHVSQDLTGTDSGTETLVFARIPAGSKLVSLQAGWAAGATAVAPGTMNIMFAPDDGSTAFQVATIAVPTIATNAFATVSAVPTDIRWWNVGTVGGTLQATESIATGTVYAYSTEYVIRNSDGSITNTGANLSNT